MLGPLIQGYLQRIRLERRTKTHLIKNSEGYIQGDESLSHTYTLLVQTQNVATVKEIAEQCLQL